MRNLPIKQHLQGIRQLESLPSSKITRSEYLLEIEPKIDSEKRELREGIPIFFRNKPAQESSSLGDVPSKGFCIPTEGGEGDWPSWIAAPFPLTKDPLLGFTFWGTEKLKEEPLTPSGQERPAGAPTGSEGSGSWGRIQLGSAFTGGARVRVRFSGRSHCD